MSKTERGLEYGQAREAVAEILCGMCSLRWTTRSGKDGCAFQSHHWGFRYKDCEIIEDRVSAILALPQMGVIASEQQEYFVGRFSVKQIFDRGWRKLVDNA